MLSKRLFFVSFFILIILTRFIKLNWGNNFFFNPDENNMASSILQMSRHSLDPKFYAYGQFPLYLTFFTTPKSDFKNIILTLRFWSAIFSCFTLLIFYLIGLKIFKQKKYSLIFVLLLIFTPGLIQSSHFGTTESILLFVFSVNILLSFKIYDTQKVKYLLLAATVSGIGLATKISSLILMVPIFLSLLFIFFKKIKIWQLFWSSLLFVSLSIIIGFILSPYNLINYPNFISVMKYEIGVATGQPLVFYTRQFIDSLPYLFQLQKVFPYVNGVPVFILGLIGFGLVCKSYFLHHKSNIYLLLTLFSSLIYFIYQGQLFTKWVRFMSPIFFVLPLVSIFIIKTIKSKIILYITIFICILPGIYYLKIYFVPDIRVQATDWINSNLPLNSKILSEGGNVVNIPLKGNYNVTNFDFYSLDDLSDNFNNLNQSIKQSNYIIIPSRRIYKNQNNPNFPYSEKYYHDLFSGNLGFDLIKTFSVNNSFLLDPEIGEETWSVFDNPVIRIYSKNNSL